MWSPERNFNVSTKENIEVPSTPSHGKWYGPRTPQTERRSSSPRESPRLSLTMFATTPRISFGKVKIGCSKVKRVVIENPLSIAQSLHLDKWPESKGFTILQPVEHGEAFQNSVLELSVEFIIPGMSEMDLPIMWKPNAEGSYRELVTLYLGDFNRLNLIVFGYAVDMAAKPVKPKMKTMLPEDIRKGAAFSSQKRKISKMDKQSTSSMKSKRILREMVKPIIKSESKLKGKHNTSRKFKAKVASKGVAPSRLRLTKHLTTERSLPRHPLPYAAKNMYYDEKWMEKQERGFVQWLNYVLTPPDELTTEVQSTSSCIFSNHETTGRQQHLAPTREVLSLRAYTAKRKMARLRRSACLLYQSQPVAFVAKTVEGEVEKNRLSIRADKHFHQDLGIKETMVKMLLSYNTLWLRIGLETIYGEVLPLQSNNDFVGLKRFLKKRFLANPDICKEYRHATVAEAYRPGYYEALKKFTLKKFLLLILFLDKAKLTRLIDHDPCLFNKDAGFKSSRLLLLTFSRDYLKGEGDVTKHLGLLNYTVTHEQAPLDEMDYAVTNLAVDLRDGLRVTRVIELLTQNWRLSANLRVPAISRLQKIHNVDVALNALKEKGVLSEEELNSVNPRHIVDGHREKTLSLLWMIILHFQVNQVVNEQQIKDEIAFLKKYYIQRKPHFKEAIVEHKDDVYCKSEKLSLLLEWCRSVCRLFGVKVDNFTVSMSDGRVMCYLLHYYHPCLLREEEICQETTQTCNPYTTEEDSIDDDSLNANDDSMALDQGESSPKLSQLKDNERRNHELLREKVKELGGVPSMLRFTDLSCTIPDEKVIITYTSYLCARLLDLRLEGRAARIVQLAWRKYREEKQAKEIKRMNRAASVIQKCVRRFLEKQRQQIILRSTIIIQAYVRGYQARRDLLHRQHAAAVIQSYYRSYRITQETRHEFTNLKRATLRVQSLYRGKIARRHVWRIKAARVIQSHLRGYMARRELLARKQAAVVLEAEVRKFLAKRRYQRLKTASVVIQRRYRAKLLTVETRRDFLNLKQVVTSLQAICRGNFTRREVKRLKAAIVIQKSVKMWRCRQEFLRSKNLITKLQAKVRRDIAKKRYLELVCAAVVIQRRWKAYRQGVVERKAYRQLKTNAVVIQSYYRKHVARKQYLARKKAVILTQACVRGFIVRKEMKRRENACCVIQRYFRAYLLMKKTAEDYKKMKKAAIYLQALWRGRTTRLQFKQQKAAIVSAQARIRGCLTRKRYLRRKSAVITLQVRYRAMKQMRNQCQAYLTTRSAIITLQAALRGHRVRQELKRMTTAATRIQAAYRCYSARARHLHLKHCVFIIQQQYRAWSLGRQVALEYRRTRDAAVVIQKYTRGMAVRKEVSRMTIAATRIQAAYRCYSARARHLHLKHCVFIVQQQYRAWSLGRQVALEYRRTRDAVVVIQKYARGMAVRKEVSRMTVAATRIQAAYRCYSARARHLHLKHCVFIIQQHYRAWSLGRQVALEYRRTRDAAVVIQKYARGMAVRKEVSRMTIAATRIQAAYRCYSARARHLHLKHCVFIVQQQYRAWSLGRQVALEYRRTRDAVVVIQKYARGMAVRKEVSRMTVAATRIQAAYRCYSARARHLHLKHCVFIIQQHYRAWSLGRQVALEYRRTRDAVVVIQKYARGMAVRKEVSRMTQAAVKIQANVKRCRQQKAYSALRVVALNIQNRFRATRISRATREDYLLKRQCVIRLQSALRRAICVKQYHRQKQAAMVLQTRWRAVLCSRKAREEYHCIRGSVITIQAFARGFRARTEVKRERAAIKIQSRWRGMVQKNSYQKTRCATIKLQARFRMLVSKRKYENLKNTVVHLQRLVRANQLCRRQTKIYQTTRDAVITLQAAVRGYRVRKELEVMNKAATRIQASFRRYFIRQQYLKIHRSALVIQRQRRATMLCRQIKTEYQSLRYSVLYLQSQVRGFIARKYFQESRRRIVLLQSAVRRIQARNNYLRKREAALTIQEHYRAYAQGCTVRKLYHLQRGACITVQANIRAWICRRRYEQLRKAAKIIQVHYRATVCAKEQRHEYLEIHRAVVTIQSFTRGWFARREVWEYRAATCIQSWWRMCVARERYTHQRRCIIRLQSLVCMWACRRRYLVLQEAAVRVQTRFRANVLCRKERDLFLEMKGSCFMIQHCYRFYRQRRLVRKMLESVSTLRNAALLLQRRFRTNQLAESIRQQYLNLKSSTILLQAAYRGYQARVQVARLRAAIVIQSYYRGYQRRSEYASLKVVTIKMQALTRGKQTCHKYKKLRAAAVVVQRRQRACTQGLLQRRIFLTQKSSAVVIQSFYRGYTERTRYQKLRQAVIKVQSLVRGNIARKAYLQLRKAAIVIQTRERARTLGLIQRSSFLVLKKYTVLLHSRFRGKRERTRFLEKKNAVVQLQALARGKRERIAFARTRKAAIILQCRERARIIGKIQRGTFLKQRRGIVLIQSIVRSQQQRTRYLELRHAVITMQAHVRGKATRNHFEKLRAAAIVLQRRERARVIGKQKRGEYLQKRKSVIFIQSLVRGHQQRTRYCKLRHATIVIQARIRQKHARDSYQSMRAAAIIIQRRERGRVLGKLQREEFHQQRRSAVLIQSVTRSYQQRTRYLQLKHAATIVQAHVRGKRAYYAYEKLRKATVVIQRRERARMLGMIERELFLTKRRCAILIQSWVRGTRERREYRRLRSATTTIQAFVRGYQQRKKYSEMKLAALCIQRRYRAYTLGREVLCRYHVIKNAIVIIQSHFRGHSARQFVKRIQASIIIQAAYRRYTARRRYLSLRKATVYVQSLQRMKWEQRQYRELRNTTITLQRRAKANQLGREAKAEYFETRQKIIHLQALWRGLKARENVRRIKSARVIQRRYRACLEGHRVRAQFVLIRKAVITMQACYRGNVARQQFKRERAARTIQAYVRGCQARVLVKKLQAEKAARLLRFSAATYVNLMVVRLQRSYRKARAIALFKAKMDRLIFLQRWWRAKLQRLSYLRTRHLVCLVQRQWRARLAVKHQSAAKIQAVVRSFLAKRTAERRKEAILIIQCAWRGYSVRKRFNTAKFKKVRQRILVANSNVTEPMKLCNRTRSALDYLLKCKNLTTVREAFVHL
ncbi:abnormal spindle-like microcephaly-associated homolog, partial [Paramuricea clavata]